MSFVLVPDDDTSEVKHKSVFKHTRETQEVQETPDALGGPVTVKRLPRASSPCLRPRRGACAMDALIFSWRDQVACAALAKFRAHGVQRAELRLFAADVHAVYPWDEAYNTLRLDANGLRNIFPLVVVMARSDRDVVQALRWAVEYGFRVAVRSGGHSAEAFSVGDQVVIDQSRRKGIAVDEAKKLVRIESGVTNGDVALALGRHGLALPAGTCATVGVAGLALGGGIGFLQRQFGLTLDNLMEADVVLADGRHVTARDKVGPRGDDHRGLFWALRGAGGGNFGIVTSLVFRVFPVKTVTLYEVAWDCQSRFVQVYGAWQKWSPTLPDSMTSELNAVLTGPGRGQGKVVVTGEFLGTEEEAKRLLVPLLKVLQVPQDRGGSGLSSKLGAAADPIDTPDPIDKLRVWTVPYVDAVRHFNGNKLRPVYRKDHSLFLPTGGLTGRGIQSMFRVLRQGRPGDRFEVETAGGRINQVANDATAFPHRHGSGFWMLVSSGWSDPAQTERRLRWGSRAFASMWRYGNQGAYVNMVDLQLGADYLRAYYGENTQRLLRVKRAYDPRNIFRFQQGVPLELPRRHHGANKNVDRNRISFRSSTLASIGIGNVTSTRSEVLDRNKDLRTGTAFPHEQVDGAEGVDGKAVASAVLTSTGRDLPRPGPGPGVGWFSTTFPCL